jgi:hypothetical protein
MSYLDSCQWHVVADVLCGHVMVKQMIGMSPCTGQVISSCQIPDGLQALLLPFCVQRHTHTCALC